MIYREFFAVSGERDIKVKEPLFRPKKPFFASSSILETVDTFWAI